MTCRDNLILNFVVPLRKYNVFFPIDIHQKDLDVSIYFWVSTLLNQLEPRTSSLETQGMTTWARALVEMII